MKKIMVAMVTLIFSLGAYAQVDSTNRGTKTGTVRESDADINKMNRNPTMQENPQVQDSAYVPHNERGIQNTPHTRDSSGTSTGQQKKTSGTIQTPTPVQQQNSVVKPTPQVKQATPKTVGNEKEKMYLVPDSTVKKK